MTPAPLSTPAFFSTEPSASLSFATFGATTVCKFHWKPRLGLQSAVWDEAVKLQSADNDYHRRDLWEAEWFEGDGSSNSG